MSLIYKLLSQEEWSHALALGRFDGSDVDREDGFIHFSAGGQAQETAAKWFAGRSDLMLLSVEIGTLGEALKWEPSRGGALFPHLYAWLPVSAVIEARPLGLGADGVPNLGRLA